MNRAELLRLPVSVDFATAYHAIGLGSTTAYRLAQQGMFPVRLLRLGSRYRVVTADLLDLLGVDAGVSENPPSVEDA